MTSNTILLLLTAWTLSYAGDLAAFTAASVYAYRAGGPDLALLRQVSFFRPLPFGIVEHLAAVTGIPESVESAEEVVSTRLQTG